MNWELFRDEKDEKLLEPLYEQEGEEGITKENIIRLDEVLDKYIDQMGILGKDASEEDILERVEKLILAINEINGDADDFLISGPEQEFLCSFINRSARWAGLETEEEDITWEWRYW